MEIRNGDYVRITEPGGHTVEGEVLEAINRGTLDDPVWELDVQSIDGEYYIWRQADDGGRVEKLPPWYWP